MADQQAPEAQPGLVRSATTNSPHATGRIQSPSTSASALRNRLLLQRQPSNGRTHSLSPSTPPLLPRRRSSILSFSSLEDATQSFTEDILHPSARKRNSNGGNDADVREDMVDPWHSSPLAFAILPALAGLFFKNGSAFVTDVLLLGLAAVFMNWSIRLPWDWYYSAQAIRRELEPDEMAATAALDQDDDVAVDTSSPGTTPKLSPEQRPQTERKPSTPDMRRREAAAADLRRQELLALLATFVFPALAAYLLHVIRAQLSRPSTGLVSDYNLSIFLLAALIRPVRQLVRMISLRTLHLQRLANGTFDSDLSSNTPGQAPTLPALDSRLTALETQLASHDVLTTPHATLAQKADVSDLSAELRKRYEPRLDGLERAVRRYEKRSTTLAMLTDQRLQSLEQRLQDALSLAAVAAQSSQNRSLVGSIVDTVTLLVAWPVKASFMLFTMPLQLLEDAYIRLKAILLGPSAVRREKRRKDDKMLMRDRAATGKKTVR